jgi:hypothetical protein
MTRTRTRDSDPLALAPAAGRDKIILYNILYNYTASCFFTNLLAPMSSPLGPVIIQGLESNSQLNGCYGSIIGSQGERLLVLLDNGTVVYICNYFSPIHTSKRERVSAISFTLPRIFQILIF